MSELPQDPAFAEFAAPKKNDSVVKDYELRGHHLPQFWLFTNKPLRAPIFTKVNALLMERKRNKLQKAPFLSEKDQNELRGLSDYIGTAPGGAQLYAQNLIDVHKEFTNLSDQHPVKLVSGQKGELCRKTCLIGEHCDTKYRERFGGPSKSVAERDTAFINQFLENAQKLKLFHGYRTITEIATFSDAEPEEVIAVFTTARTVRKVLKNSYF